ncbi:hypothetical protein HID58_088845 [Brassica napus]|uniref:Uncharacterized protein n=1 Tax=Brassica napus TaxID=3708 RepID=A0ABQ7XXC7_BRANA|nr:hypothetical protein HID58_088845 [Brassica napus]
MLFNVSQIKLSFSAQPKRPVQPDNVWCYIGCSKCSKKLLREISSHMYVL